VARCNHDEAMTSDDQPVKVYQGELADVVFLRSLLIGAGIEMVNAGRFYGPDTGIYVRRRDVDAAREIVTDFESERSRGKKGEVIRGPWSPK